MTRSKKRLISIFFTIMLSCSIIYYADSCGYNRGVRDATKFFDKEVKKMEGLMSRWEMQKKALKQKIEELKR